MASRTKRVALALRPEINDPLTELSLLLNQPKTAIITEVLESSLPAFHSMIKAINTIKKGEVDNAFSAMETLLADAVGMAKQATLDIDEAKGKNRGR